MKHHPKYATQTQAFIYILPYVHFKYMCSPISDCSPSNYDCMYLSLWERQYSQCITHKITSVNWIQCKLNSPLVDEATPTKDW